MFLLKYIVLKISVIIKNVEKRINKTIKYLTVNYYYSYLALNKK